MAVSYDRSSTVAEKGWDEDDKKEEKQKSKKRKFWSVTLYELTLPLLCPDAFHSGYWLELMSS